MARYATDRSFRFPHHTLRPDEPRGESTLLDAEFVLANSDPSRMDFRSVPQALRAAGVSKIVLVHGTFAGGDVMGILREIGRYSPVSARRLHELGKRWVDDLAGELGNYTESYANYLNDLVNPASLPPIVVERFGWSGENHHLGRADGAMSLLERISDQPIDGRVLLLAHSHGGNLLAMLSLIVGADAKTKRAFFDSTRLHYHSPIRSKVDFVIWERMRKRLVDDSQFRLPPMDVATFGTPLRYRWNRRVCPRLLHFVHHRPLVTGEPRKASFPRSVQDAFAATGGDSIQQLGIGGTDFFPSIFAWRDWMVERRMRWLFESTARRRDVLKKIMRGRRESSDGTTLLVDYPTTDDNVHQKLFGHGVYTCRQWLPFHLQMICKKWESEE